MKHLIVLDGRTPTGLLFLNGKHNGLTSDGVVTHPLLDCIAIDFDSPGYICATRVVPGVPDSHQVVLLPSHTVVAVYRYAATEKLPIGFLPPARPVGAPQT
jgi:hypothetical protein